jgi:hypothetical protein
MGRPRKIESPELMEQLWEEYKNHCDNYETTVTEFSSKQGEFITGTVKKKVTYTIEGFCVYLKMARCRFYDTYAEREEYRDIVTRMRDECEIDARQKFETGTIPTQLSGLWMSKYDYTTKQQTDVKATVTPEDMALLNKVSKRLEEDKKQAES